MITIRTEVLSFHITPDRFRHVEHGLQDARNMQLGLINRSWDVGGSLSCSQVVASG